MALNERGLFVTLRHLSKIFHIHIRIPNDRGKVNQFSGNRYVCAGSLSDPGVSGLMKPSINTIRTTRRR
jgi:hypothetical protein